MNIGNSVCWVIDISVGAKVDRVNSGGLDIYVGDEVVSGDVEGVEL